MSAYINHVACAVPSYERQGAFLDSLPRWVGPPDVAEKLRQIVAGAQIDERYTVLPEPFGPNGFYEPGAFPTTGERMKVYRQEAPKLAFAALERLREQTGSFDGVTHLIVTSCTGFCAPGLDIDIVRDHGLAPTTERTLIGFMGCHAALIGLRTARRIVR